jgi:hypothetical protein
MPAGAMVTLVIGAVTDLSSRRWLPPESIDTLTASGSVSDRNRLLSGDFFFLKTFHTGEQT